MPFIPFSNSYKSSVSNTSLDQETMTTSNPFNMIAGGNRNRASSTASNSNNNNNLSANTTSMPTPFPGGTTMKTNPGSANSSQNNSSNNSPLIQQGGSFPLRRKTSVGNALFSLVSSIRQPNMGQPSSSRQGSSNGGVSGANGSSGNGSTGGSGTGNRRNSQSSNGNPRSRSTSFSRLTKQSSNNNNNNNNNTNTSTSTSDELERAREEVESANPFQVSMTPEWVDQFETQRASTPGSRSRRNENRSDPQLTTILSNGEGIQEHEEEEEEEYQDAAIDLSGLGLQSSTNQANLFFAPPVIGGRVPPVFNPEGNSNSISITNGDNNAHNTFNPAAYDYSMSNSQTIANFRVYANGGLLGDGSIPEEDGVNTGRTRGDTLRGEMFESVVMNTENNPTVGTAINNPITIEDMSDMEVEEVFEVEPPVVAASTTTPRAAPTPTASNTRPTSRSNGNKNKDANGFYSIRLTPSIDHSSTHPYMFFGPIIRKLKPGKNNVILIGRYTEKSKKAATAPAGSSEPVVFKSKVVSRKHAELAVDEEGRWSIQDIKSSSGTFLNHVRLSLPNTESAKTYINDSDIIQLGVDYRGGSEEMYRCVKVKVELNYSWKKKGAKFSKEAHEKLRNLTNKKEDELFTPCVICLDDIKPCQAVFVSSCSHSWHYKCIRPLLVKTYPQFLCPNCKAVCDLEADLEEDEEGGSEEEEGEEEGEEGGYVVEVEGSSGGDSLGEEDKCVGVNGGSGLGDDVME